MRYSNSRELQQKSHALIPGGCHTYAKGDDQFPLLAPGFIARGEGSHVWDVDGNEFIEYGMGCRAVTLGHAFPPVLKAAQEEMLRGTNFSRPAPIELECAEELLGMIEAAEMAKFSKEGSTATTGAVKLSRAHTGRDMVALCHDHPFFAVHDWFIGTTAIDGGIPESVKKLSVTFRYNNPESVRYLFEKHPGRIACVILEPAKYEEPRDHFLHKVQEICREHGALFVLDEMITGFRWHNGGAQHTYDIAPDLSAFGKALANGYSVSALVGKREYMELGGLYHDRERVFLLSTTHGAETHALAAAIATMPNLSAPTGRGHFARARNTACGGNSAGNPATSRRRFRRRDRASVPSSLCDVWPRWQAFAGISRPADAGADRTRDSWPIARRRLRAQQRRHRPYHPGVR